MKFYILASLMLFILVLSRTLSKQKKKQQQQTESFWARERQANAVRRKSLDNLEYIHIPFDSLPTRLRAEHPVIKECLEILQTLSEQPIVNFTGKSNTDLKLEYGTSNITALSNYDQNYTLLVRTLQKWADVLWDLDCRAEAAAVMEFAVSTRTDISRTYYKLAEYYHRYGETEKIAALVETAKSLNSANCASIVHKLQESYP